MADNTVTLIGNLTRDPELRYTSGGRGVCSFGLAVNRRYQQGGEWQEQVSFIDVTAWADLGENLAASLAKGARVIVQGRMEQRSWEDNEGNKRSKVEVVADDVGASLRWAQATIERTVREKSERREPAPAARDYGTDEEPFLRLAEVEDLMPIARYLCHSRPSPLI